MDWDLGDAEDACHCPSKTVSQSDARALFEGLDAREEYFPLVSRHINNSFYGIVPPSATPQPVAAHRRSTPSISTHTISISSGSTRAPSPIFSQEVSPALQPDGPGMTTPPQHPRKDDNQAGDPVLNMHVDSVTSGPASGAHRTSKSTTEATDAAASAAYLQDCKTWETWRATELVKTFQGSCLHIGQQIW